MPWLWWDDYDSPQQLSAATLAQLRQLIQDLEVRFGQG